MTTENDSGPLASEPDADAMPGAASMRRLRCAVPALGIVRARRSARYRANPAPARANSLGSAARDGDGGRGLSAGRGRAARASRLRRRGRGAERRGDTRREVPVERPAQAVFEVRARLEAEALAGARRVEHAARLAVGLRAVPDDAAAVPADAANQP